MPEFVDLTGKTFGKWSVIEKSEHKGKQVAWLCRCDCGSESIVVGASLVNGRSKSCGCISRELISHLNKSHGLSKTAEYRNWKSMIRRCENKNTKEFKYYGGRGIKVCDRWRNSFETFLADMGERPSSKHTLDRKDCDADYSPENCRWATKSLQSINRRMFKTNSSGVTGVVLDKKTNHWTSSIQINRKHIYLGYFSRKEDAIKARKDAEKKYFSKPS